MIFSDYLAALSQCQRFKAALPAFASTNVLFAAFTDDLIHPLNAFE